MASQGNCVHTFSPVPGLLTVPLEEPRPLSLPAATAPPLAEEVTGAHQSVLSYSELRRQSRDEQLCHRTRFQERVFYGSPHQSVSLATTKFS